MSIEPFTLYDLEFDLAELEPADHDATTARIRWHLSTPYAVCLKSVYGEALVSGMGLAIANSGSGWVGDRLMHPRFRGAELEGELVAALVKRLEAMGCTSQLAVVHEASVPVFSAQGFRPDGMYVRYASGKCEAPSMDEVELFEQRHVVGLFRLDQLASGEDRRTLLNEHAFASRVFVRKGRTMGYYIVLLGEGLMVAENALAGEELLRWHLPNNTSITLPAANAAAIGFLQDRGYTEQHRLHRMVRGVAPAWKPEMIWGWIGEHLG